MIQMVKLVRRRKEFSLQDFRAWWTEEIGSRVARLGGLERYVLSPAIEEDPAATYHGISQMGFSSEESARQFLASPAYREVLALEAKGLDTTASTEFMTWAHLITETVPLRRDSQLVMKAWAFKRKPGMSVENFQDYYLNHHTRYSLLLPGQRVYFQLHTHKSEYVGKEPPFDGVTMTWYDDQNALARMLGSVEFARGVADGQLFLDFDQFTSVTAENHRLIWGESALK